MSSTVGRKPYALIAAGVAITVVTGCGSSSSTSGSTATSSKSDFQIVIDTGTSGAYAANGQSAVTGVKTAANVLNKSGGILGHKVTVQVLDNGGNPTTAASLLSQRLASGTKPSLIEPGAISTEGVAEVPIASSSKVLSIGTPNDASLNDPKKYPYNFLIAPAASRPSDSFMSYAKSKGWTRIAMISSADAYGATVAQATVAAAKKAGVTLYSATYNDTDLDVTAPLEELKSHNPQALFMQSFGAPAGVILSSRQKLQWNVPVVGDLTTSNTPLIATESGTDAERNLVVQVSLINDYSSAHSAADMAFIAALKSHGSISAVLTTTSYQYDSIMVVAAAAKQAGSIETPAIAKALEQLKQPTSPPWVTLKSYVFSSDNHSPAADASNWIYIAPTKLVDGQFGAPGA